MSICKYPETPRNVSSFFLWGTEFWMVNNELYCMKYLKVNPGFQCSIHCHKNKDETFLGVSGYLQIDIHNRSGKRIGDAAIEPGGWFRIKPRTYHSFHAYNTVWVMEVSTHHDDKDVVRIQESRKLEP